ncbi:MAG: type II toxin-antitoxin system RelE/ParE family toxin [Alphaproteobacteria bacterium]|nr:type II toxin-antitoxin system RelE/ParE family toxin [Alphaproteobacteria bacterium]
MAFVRYTRGATRDLDAIGDYVARENPHAARRLLGSMRRKCRMIAETPNIGRLRDEFGEAIRCVPNGSYLIFYRPTGAGITIIRILHGARDLGEAFRVE